VDSQSDHKNVDTVEFSKMYNCTSYVFAATFKSNRFFCRQGLLIWIFRPSQLCSWE